jgi:hypothetical protein
VLTEWIGISFTTLVFPKDLSVEGGIDQGLQVKSHPGERVMILQSERIKRSGLGQDICIAENMI